MSNKNKKSVNNKNNKRRIITKEERKAMRTDSAYWNQPLWYRIYCRIMYAVLAFIVVSGFFSVYSSWGIVMQCVLGGLVSLAVLLWRVAFPNGFGDPWELMMEGASQAMEEQQKAQLKQSGAAVPGTKNGKDGKDKPKTGNDKK